MTPQPLHNARHPNLERWGRSLMVNLGERFPTITSWLGFQLFATPLRGYYPIPAEQTAILQRAQKATLHTQCDGRRQRLRAYVWPADPLAHRELPTVLLMHGWMCTAALMTSFVEPLCQAGFRVVAIDGPAHGESLGWQTNLPQFSEAIQAVSRQFGTLAGVVGHSFGGAAAVMLQQEQVPHGRGGSLEKDWKKLVLISVPAETKFMMHVIAQALNVSPGVELDMQRRFLDRYGIPIEDFSIARWTKDLRLPGLVIHDRNDGMIPFEQGEAIAQCWPGAEFYASEGTSHSGVLHSPPVIQKVLDFLNREH